MADLADTDQTPRIDIEPAPLGWVNVRCLWCNKVIGECALAPSAAYRKVCDKCSSRNIHYASALYLPDIATMRRIVAEADAADREAC